MAEELVELTLQGIFLLGYAVASALLAGLGVAMEYQSYLYSNSGELILAVWMAGFGLVALAFAYTIATDKVSRAYVDLREQI